MGAKKRTIDIKFPSAKTLLTDFIEKKAREYDAPERKGTPKGQTIGFSPHKYCVLLLFLHETKVKDAAQKIGVSYGVLRKWRTEPEFKSRREALEKEFAKAWCKHFWAHHTINFISDKKEPKRKKKEDLLSDSHQYSKSLVDAIYFEMGQSYLLDESIAKQMGGEMILFQNFMDFTSATLKLEPQGEVAKKIRMVFKKNKKKHIARAGKELKLFIKKKNPSLEARETALRQLHFILVMSS